MTGENRGLEPALGGGRGVGARGPQKRAIGRLSWHIGRKTGSGFRAGAGRTGAPSTAPEAAGRRGQEGLLSRGRCQLSLLEVKNWWTVSTAGFHIPGPSPARPALSKAKAEPPGTSPPALVPRLKRPEKSGRTDPAPAGESLSNGHPLRRSPWVFSDPVSGFGRPLNVDNLNLICSSIQISD